MTRADSHVLFRRQVILRDAGLLTETEETALAEHAETCSECRKLLEDGVGEEAGTLPPEGHIPAELVARWDRVRATVEGLERSLLAEHLASCKTCRRELEWLGCEPSLPAVHVEQGAGGRVGEASVQPEAGSSRVRLEPRVRLRAWLQGGLVGAALAAAAAVVIVQIPGGHGGSETLPWVVPGTLRGSAPTVEVSPETRRVLLAIPTPSGSLPERAAHLTVTGPSGSLLADRDIDASRLAGSTLMVVLTTSHPLDAGLYTVSLALEGEAEPHASTFRVAVSER